MKSKLKSLLHFLFAIIALPFTLSFYLFSLLGDKNNVLAAYSQFFSLFPGIIGNYFRASFYRFVLKRFSSDVVFSFGSLISQNETEILSGVYVGPQCNIGLCKIEQDTLLGSGVHIMSGKNQHNFDDINVPIRNQGGVFEKVIIGKNCWLGNGSLVMANIGDNCIIAAGSVVINDIPSNSIVAGNPGKIIKKRTEK